MTVLIQKICLGTWINLFVALVDLGYIRPKELKEQGSTGETCKYHLGA